jgi:hypothetical protein
MDQARFDTLVKCIARARGATSQTRRGRTRGQRGTPQQGCPKVGICHRTRSLTGAFQYIEVCRTAVPAHAAHGDLVACPGHQVIDPHTCTCTCPTTVVEACRQDHGFVCGGCQTICRTGPGADFPCTCLTSAEGVVRCGFTASNEAPACAIPCQTSAQCAQRLGAGFFCVVNTCCTTPVCVKPC